MVVGWPGAAQDRLPADVPGTRRRQVLGGLSHKYDIAASQPRTRVQRTQVTPRSCIRAPQGTVAEQFPHLARQSRRLYNGLVTWDSLARTSDCERVRPTGVAQPMNASTSLVYLPAGIGVLFAAQRTAGPLRATLTAYAAALAATAVGSVSYHGRQPSRAHQLHDGSLQITFALACGLLTRVALAGGARWHNPRFRRLLIVVALASGAYGAGRSGSPLCHPDSPLQLHAAWHLLSALAAVIVAQAAADGPVAGTNGSDAKREAEGS